MRDSSFIVIVVAAILLSGAVFYYSNVETSDYFSDNIPYSSKSGTSVEDKKKIIEAMQNDGILATSTAATTPSLEEMIEDVIIEVEDTQEVFPETIEAPVVDEEVQDTIEEPQAEEEEVPVIESKPSISFSDINTSTRDALVNIFCTTKGPHQYVTPISGSGTIVSEDGVVLTNAHIAQLYLFENYPSPDFVDCIIRTGSPARAMYRAKLLYISPDWIEDNAEAIRTENPTGSGEDDFAFLIITEAVQNQTLPESFPYISLDATEQNVMREEKLLVAAYPAGLLGGKIIQQSLYSASAITEAMELYTFDSGSLDIISLGGTVVSQQGSSGGPVVNKEGNVIALISTSSDGDTTAERDLRGITIEHIERSLTADNGTTLEDMLSGDLKEKAAVFNETTAPSLLQILLTSF